MTELRRRRGGRWIAAMLLAALLPAGHSFAEVAVALPDSVKPVEQAPPTGKIDTQKPLVARNSVVNDNQLREPIPIAVSLKMRNFAELQGRLARGERISPREMAARYEPLGADYEAVAAWVAGQGLTVTRRDEHHMAIFARGKVGDVARAFQVKFARVTFHGTEYSSAITAPSVPAGLSGLLVGINGLQPHIRPHKHIVKQAVSGGGSYFPKQIAQAYNVTGLYNSNIAGSGQSIAIVIDTFPVPGDLEAFWRAAGVNQSIANIQFIQAVAGTLPQPSGEETLDVEWSSAMAPSAHVRVYAALDLGSADLDQAYQQVYDDVTNHPELGIHQMSMSYGEGETYTTNSQVQTDDQYFAELAAAGVTVFASSGDDGATPGANGTGDENGPVQVENPASDPNVTGVGGTTLILDSQNNPTSEVVWNENGGASGGGFSEYFARPSWQKGTGVASQNKRQVPDVAATADPNYGAVIIQGGVQQTVGGTSWSSPMWAGFCALINQARANSGQAPIGLLGPYIYPLLSSPNYPANYGTDFRDISSGNNATSRSGGDYSTTAGYDLCTGLGTPHAQPLTELVVGSATLVGVQMPAAVQQVAPGESASFTVAVSGASATYQWQRMAIGTSTWSDLTDSGPYAGSAGPTLTISGATAAMSGDQFQCLVTIGSSAVTTAPPSVLIVDTPLSVAALAGRAGVTGLANGHGTSALFNYPSGVGVDSFGNLFIADYGNNQIREIAPGGAVSTPYGSLGGAAGSSNGPGNSALFNSPNGVAVDSANNLYIADSGNNSIRKISSGVVSTVAGGQLNAPEGVAVDGTGNVYVADSGNNVIRKITPSGTVSILAGRNGIAGYADGAATTKALFNNPSSVAVDGLGNVYVADFNNSVVRKISSGVVTTVAGQAGEAGYLDGLGPSTLFNAPIGLAVDSANNLYIADCQVPQIGSNAAGNDLLRKLSPAGVVSTLAGQAGGSGSVNGTGTDAQFYSLQAVAQNSEGVFYLADTYNQTIRTGSAGGGSGPSPTRIISLSGTLAFGNVTVDGTASGILTIQNTGNSTLTVSGIAYPAGFSGDWASGSIAAGGSQDVTVSFAPTAQTSYGGDIVVTSDATGGVDFIAASGVGVIVNVAPTVATSSASGINGSSATLSGTVNPDGAATTVYFEYGLTGTYGSISESTSAGVGISSEPFSIGIGGLTPDTTYHYQAVALNAGGTVYGGDQTFTTLAFTTLPTVASGASASGVPGAEFSILGNPAINAFDYLAFKSTLLNGPGGVVASDNTGIWAANSAGTRELVARTGGMAAGAGTALFSSLGNPVYNDNEAVAFVGALQIAAGRATAANATGIWSNSGGLLELVARQGNHAPGFAAGATFAGFSALALPDQGGVLFVGSVSTGQVGIWAGESAASLQSLARVGGSLSGSNGNNANIEKTIASLSFLRTAPFVNGQSRSFAQGSGHIVYRAGFTDHTSGIVTVAGTSTQFAAQSLDSAAGVPGAVFSAFGDPALNANDRVAFRAILVSGSGGVTGSDNAGIWADDGTGTRQLIARTGNPAPGTGAVFGTLGDPVYNAGEAVAFRGVLKVAAGQATAANAVGIWSNAGGTPTPVLVARTGSTQAPGCPVGATFKTFTAFALPDQGGVIFLATLNPDGAAGVTSASNTGIWAVDTGGNLQLIARKGSTVNGKTITSLSFLPVLGHVAGQTRNFSQGTGDLVYEATFSDHSTGIFTVVFQ